MTLRQHSTLEKTLRALVAGALLFVVASATSCGYHVAGRASSLPPDTKTIAIPAFQNRTTSFKIEQKLTAAVIKEFLERTKYRIVSNEADGDLVLRGTVKNLSTAPVIFDPQTGRATTVAVVVEASIQLVDSKTHRTIFENPNYVFREQYEIAGDLQSFFEEQGPALDRLARDFASTVVTAVLENF